MQRDAEGYSVPSSAVDDITRAQQEAAAGYETVPSLSLTELTYAVMPINPNLNSL